jgi:hypothetical protein
MGSDKAQDPDSEDNEAPKHEVTLAGLLDRKDAGDSKRSSGLLWKRRGIRLTMDALNGAGRPSVRYVSWGPMRWRTAAGCRSGPGCR